jgi:hypothetical protein
VKFAFTIRNTSGIIRQHNSEEDFVGFSEKLQGWGCNEFIETTAVGLAGATIEVSVSGAFQTHFLTLAKDFVVTGPCEEHFGPEFSKWTCKVTQTNGFIGVHVSPGPDALNDSETPISIKTLNVKLFDSMRRPLALKSLTGGHEFGSDAGWNEMIPIVDFAVYVRCEITTDELSRQSGTEKHSLVQSNRLQPATSFDAYREKVALVRHRLEVLSSKIAEELFDVNPLEGKVVIPAATLAVATEEISTQTLQCDNAMIPVHVYDSFTQTLTLQTYSQEMQTNYEEERPFAEITSSQTEEIPEDASTTAVQEIKSARCLLIKLKSESPPNNYKKLQGLVTDISCAVYCCNLALGPLLDAENGHDQLAQSLQMTIDDLHAGQSMLLGNYVSTHHPETSEGIISVVSITDNETFPRSLANQEVTDSIMNDQTLPSSLPNQAVSDSSSYMEACARIDKCMELIQANNKISLHDAEVWDTPTYSPTNKVHQRSNSKYFATLMSMTSWALFMILPFLGLYSTIFVLCDPHLMVARNYNESLIVGFRPICESHIRPAFENGKIVLHNSIVTMIDGITAGVDHFEQICSETKVENIGLNGHIAIVHSWAESSVMTAYHESATAIQTIEIWMESTLDNHMRPSSKDSFAVRSQLRAVADITLDDGDPESIPFKIAHEEGTLEENEGYSKDDLGFSKQTNPMVVSHASEKAEDVYAMPHPNHQAVRG